LLKIPRESRNVGLGSAYTATQEALRGFKELPNSFPTAFIFTGNVLNQIAIPGVLSFASPKAVTAMLIEYGADAYGHIGYRYVNPSPLAYYNRGKRNRH
jgi:hypothetical protein